VSQFPTFRQFSDVIEEVADRGDPGLYKSGTHAQEVSPHVGRISSREYARGMSDPRDHPWKHFFAKLVVPQFGTGDPGSELLQHGISDKLQRWIVGTSKRQRTNKV
jgi:hypothetical protein